MAVGKISSYEDVNTILAAGRADLCGKLCGTRSSFQVGGAFTSPIQVEMNWRFGQIDEF